MNFSLENFELQFPSDLLLAGEQLYDKKAIHVYEEIERNLWSFEIKDRERYEVEILISPSRVNNYSCECNSYVTSKQCKHIVASLYLLRLLKTKKVKDTITYSRNVPKKLNISNILQQVHPDDLKNFIKNYAKKNKNFATSLKANFARSIELEDNEYKYENILSGIVKPATKIQYRISFQTIKQLVNVANQFDAQFEDAISLKQYKEAFYIIKAIMAKLAYVNHWTLSEKKEIIELSIYSHKQYQNLLKLEIPPSLILELVSFGLELANRSYYHIVDPLLNFFIILADSKMDKTQIPKLSKILFKNFKSEQLHERELEKLWIVKQLFEENGIFLPESIKPTLSSQSTYRISDKLDQNNAFTGLLSFLDNFKEKGKLKDINLAKRYVKVLFEKGEVDLFVSECLEYTVLHKDIYFWELLKEKTSEDTTHFFRQLSEQLSHKKTLLNQRLYLRLLKSEFMISEAMDYISNSRYSFDLIKTFGDFLSTEEEFFSKTIITSIDNYLNEFLGSESAAELRSLILYLKHNEFQNAYKNAKSHVLKNYEDRKNLVKEIKQL